MNPTSPYRLLLCCAAALLLTLPAARADHRHTPTDSLLTVLDRTLDGRQQFVREKYRRIAAAKRTVLAATDNDPRLLFRAYRDLTEEYTPFLFDSALYYSNKTIEQARLLDDPALEIESSIEQAEIYMTGGIFSEALHTLEGLDRRPMDSTLLARYYSACELTWLHNTEFAGGGFLGDKYRKIGLLYLDSLNSVAGYAVENLRIISRLHIEYDDPEIAKIKLTRLLSRTPFGTRDYAIVAATLSYCYLVQPEGDLRKRYLILSAISDIRAAVKENESLRQLAYMLYEEGDIERAYRYISVSMEDANFYNARLRSIETAELLPIIGASYHQLEQQNYRRLQVLISVISLLTVVLLLIGWSLRKRNRQLRRAQADISRINAEFMRFNEQLADANRSKLEMLTSFLMLCASYINKLDRFQSTVQNMLALEKLRKLREMVSSSDMIDREIREFYTYFDRTILKLYPGFIDNINRLLRPDEQIVPPADGTLTAELRIYALVCMGITDSMQIANFLRYSNNTIYTYRTRIRNKAVDKEHFDEHVQQIGLFQP